MISYLAHRKVVHLQLHLVKQNNMKYIKHMCTCKGEGKIVPVLFFSWALHHEGILDEWRYSSTHSLTLALDGGEWLASCPSHFTPKEKAPGTHWIVGWVGPRAVLDALMRKIP